MRLRVLLLLLAIAILFVWRQRTVPLFYYSPTVYVDRAQKLIDSGVLLYDCPRRRIVFKGSAAAEVDKKWFAASYLKNDVATFNSQPELYGHFFVIAGCRLISINPHLRTIRLPFSSPVEWFGNIDYSGPGANARLQSSRGRSITLDAADPALPDLSDARTTVGAPDRVAANIVHIDFDPQPDPAVEIHNALDKTIIEQRVKATSHGEVRLLGQRLSGGRIAALHSGDWLHFDTGGAKPKTETFLFTGEQHPEHVSVVQLRNSRRERSYEEDSESILGSVGGERRGEILSLPRAVARAVTNALQDLSGKRGEELSSKFDVQLTIDQRFQRTVDAVLRQHAEETADQQTDGELFAASATVMNGKTGDVLVAASYPAEEDLTDAERINPNTAKRLLVNHNLKRHPIGSAGKPFFYAAIADQHPFLMNLVVEPHRPQPNLYGGSGEVEDLQYLLPSEYKLWNHSDAPMDFESALERSCNKYTIELATLALAMSPQDHSAGGAIEDHLKPEPAIAWPKPGQSSGVSFSGRRLEFAPSIARYMKGEPLPVAPNAVTSAVLQPGNLERIDEAPFIEKLSQITGVPIYKGLAPAGLSAEVKAQELRTAYGTLAYDQRPWRSLIEMLSTGEPDDARWKIRAAFQGVSPERVNLATNLITDLRREYVAMLLGGTSSQWTNVQLAESLSRLVTDRQIQASFIQGINDHGSPVPPKAAAPPPPELEISQEVRERVLSGMRRVVEGKQGTAAPELGPALQALRKAYPDADVAIFSKTGSPTVYRQADRPASLLLRYMVENGRLSFDRDRVVVLSRARKVGYEPLRSSHRGSFVAELAKAVATASAETKVATTSASTRAILRVIDRLQHRLRTFRFDSPSRVRFDEDTSSPIYVLGDHLVLNDDDPFFDRATTSDSSAVYIFSLVKWHGGNTVPTREQLAAPDARVVTTAIYMDVGPGSRVAVELAAKLIPVLTPLLR